MAMPTEGVDDRIEATRTGGPGRRFGDGRWSRCDRIDERGRASGRGFHV
jgi:hypothetical protein